MKTWHKWVMWGGWLVAWTVAALWSYEATRERAPRWKMVPITEAQRGYNNVQYPAYLFNEQDGTLLVVGEATFDTNKDHVTDRWSTIIKYLYPQSFVSNYDDVSYVEETNSLAD